tara:strand:- start:902 stop:2986 length:2085 start_codon:yes stop_codon:yes gene_type:complete
MKNHFIIFVFFVLNIFLIFISVGDFNIFRGVTHANYITDFKSIGLHEYENFGILNKLLGNISFVNILFPIFFFFTVCSFGFYLLERSIFSFIFQNIDEFEKKIILFIGSFSLGSLIFVGIYRILSLNISIQFLNLLISIYLIFFIFFYLYKIKINYQTFIKNIYLIFIITFIFAIILIFQIDIGDHHIVGDAFYNYGYKKILLPLIYSENYVPIIGTHYFEEIFLYPIIYFLNELLYDLNIEYTTFQIQWVYQAFGKLSSICLIYICFRFFENSKYKCLLFTLIIFATNLSGSYFYNPTLFGTGSNFLLTTNQFRPTGIFIFIFVTACFFLKPETKNSYFDYLTFIVFLVGVSSFGIQISFLFLIFYGLIYIDEIGSIKIIYTIRKFLYEKFEFIVLLSIFSIFVTYFYIGQDLSLYKFAPYVLLIPLILSFLNFYSLNFSQTNFRSRNFIKLNFFLLLIFFILFFLGNIFTYKVMFSASPSQIDFLKVINDQIVAHFSYANSLLAEGKYIYRELIHFEEKNVYQINNICTQRNSTELKHMIAGLPPFHCIGGIKHILYGLGFLFTMIIVNIFLVKISFNNQNKSKKEKYFIFLFSLSLFFLTFSLFFMDMIDGRYMVHARTRFLEISYALVVFLFLIMVSNYVKVGFFSKIIYFILILKVALPFSLNFTKDKSWFVNQFVENAMYLFASLNII